VSFADITSFLFPHWTLSTGAAVANACGSKADLPAPARSLNFELVQSQIELTWGLVKLADGLKTLDRMSEAEKALETATSALLKAQSYADDLRGPESLAAFSNLRSARDVIAAMEFRTTHNQQIRS
jgi:hypothetical protein